SVLPQHWVVGCAAWSLSQPRAADPQTTSAWSTLKPGGGEPPALKRVSAGTAENRRRWGIHRGGVSTRGELLLAAERRRKEGVRRE
ncbi:hypothetical protein AAVH_43786, partial [Aphelenchoides avenae]